MRASAGETLALDLVTMELFQVIINLGLLCMQIEQQLVLYSANGNTGSDLDPSREQGRSS